LPLDGGYRYHDRIVILVSKNLQAVPDRLTDRRRQRRLRKLFSCSDQARSARNRCLRQWHSPRGTDAATRLRKLFSCSRARAGRAGSSCNRCLRRPSRLAGSKWHEHWAMMKPISEEFVLHLHSHSGQGKKLWPKI